MYGNISSSHTQKYANEITSCMSGCIRCSDVLHSKWISIWIEHVYLLYCALALTLHSMVGWIALLCVESYLIVSGRLHGLNRMIQPKQDAHPHHHAQWYNIYFHREMSQATTS